MDNVNLDSGFEDRLKISAIMAVRNGAKTIRETLASIAGQSYPVHEIVIVDDCSKDGSADIAESALIECDIPGRLIRLDRPIGAGAARNLAVAESSGDIVAILDSDDCWTPGHLHHAMVAFKHHPYLVGYCSRVDVRQDSSWRTQGRVYPENPGYVPEGRQNTFRGLLAGLNLWNVTLCLRKSAFLEAKGYHEELKCYEDLWLLLNASRSGYFYLSNHVGCTVRVRADSLSSSSQAPGQTVMSKAMFADRISMIKFMKEDDRFSPEDLALARNSAITFIAEAFKDACRARAWDQAASIMSSTLKKFWQQPTDVFRTVNAAIWVSLCSGIPALWSKVVSVGKPRS